MFEVEDELEVADAFEGLSGGGVGAGAEAAELPGAHGGGAAAEEALLVGHGEGVAVGDADAEEEACDEGGAGAEVGVAREGTVEAHILGEGDAEELEDAVAVGLQGCHVGDASQEVAGALDREAEEGEVAAGAELLVGVGVVVAGIEDEVGGVLVFESEVVEGVESCLKVGVEAEHADEGELDGEELVLCAAVLAPGVAEGGVGQDALEGVAVLVAAAEGDEGVGACALPAEVGGVGEEEGGYVEGGVEGDLEGVEVVVEALLAALEDEFGKFEEERAFDAEQLGAAEEVLVLVLDRGFEAEVAAGEEGGGGVLRAQGGGVGELEGEGEALLGGVDQAHMGVDQREGVGGGGGLVELDVDILEVAEVEERVVGVLHIAWAVGHAGEEHEGAGDGLRAEGHGFVVDELVVEIAGEAGVVVDEGVEGGLAAAEAGGGVGVDEDVVDVVDAQVAAVDIDIDGEALGVVGGVDEEGDVVGGGAVEALFAEVGDEACALGGEVVLVVRVAGAEEGGLAPLVEQSAHGVALGVVGHFVDGVAVGGADVVADGDFLLAQVEGVEGDGGAEASLLLEQALELLGGAAGFVLVVDDGGLAESAPVVAPEGAVLGRGDAVDAHADGEPHDAEHARVAALEVVVVRLLECVLHQGRHLGGVGHGDGLHRVVQAVGTVGDVAVGVAAGEEEAGEGEEGYM